MTAVLILGNYHFHSLIFSSEKTAVYQAFDSVHNESVIIKVLKGDAPTTEQLTKFKYEYEITKKLTRGAVNVYALETYNQSLALVMEDFGGIALTYFLSKRSLDIPYFLELSICLINTLEDIHSQHVIHSDVNPSNIVYNPDSKVAKFIDFGNALTLDKEFPTLKSLNNFASSLPYISPEQTGLMNCPIDYRTDYYSLGVTFYEMLTGTVPFHNDNPLNLIYMHLTEVPQAPHELNPEIPVALSNIVMKLLSKRPSERYQSAYGLIADLLTCADQLKRFEKIQPFELGIYDVSSKFLFPEKLYGRENEIAELLATFDRISHGQTEVLLITGSSGVGKSSFINELKIPVAVKRGNFVIGKFEQLSRDIPFSAIIQALNQLVLHILNETPNSILKWKESLERTLKNNVNVITALVPALEKIVGTQPPPAELGPVEALTRFNRFLRLFLQVFATAEHPLVLFLDDLQWIDSASLQALEQLIAGEPIPYLLLAGAYRNNEVNEMHPLLMTINELLKKSALIQTVNLYPLKMDHIVTLLKDTLHQSNEAIQSLAKLCYMKTQGNPFFLKQLLVWLTEEGLIEFNSKKIRWLWNTEVIQQKYLPLGASELMTRKLQKLSDETKEILMLAAVIGSRFDVHVLSLSSRRSIHDIAKGLQEALLRGLIIPEQENYKYIQEHITPSLSFHFTHDIVHKAVYNLIVDANKTIIHYEVGLLMHSKTPHESLDERIFEIVKHLNFSSDLIRNVKDRLLVLELNLHAGRKSRELSAFKAATEYLQSGKNLLSVNAWEKYHSLTFELLKELSACYCIIGGGDRAEINIQDLINHCNTPLQRAEIAKLQILLYTTAKKDNEKAIQAAIQGLDVLGIKITRNPSKISFIKEVALTKWNLGRRKISNLIDSPILVNPIVKMQIELLIEFIPLATAWGDKFLAGNCTVKAINLSLKHGTIPAIATPYIVFALLLNTLIGDFKQSFEYGKLAVALSEKYPDMHIKCRVLLYYTLNIHPWVYHWQTLYPLIKKAIALGLETGDLFHASIGCLHVAIWNPNMHLEFAHKEGEKYLNLIKHSNFSDNIYALQAAVQFEANLLGLTSGSQSSYSDSVFDEEEFVQKLKTNNYNNAYNIYSLFKAITSFLYYDKEAALQHLREVDRTVYLTRGLFAAAHCLHGFLIHAANYRSLTFEQKKHSHARMLKEYAKMKQWATLCPINFAHSKILMEAEFARLAGDYRSAIQLYEKAIQTAKKNDFLRIEALANELAGKFYFEFNLHKFAKMCFTEAYYCYSKWGAIAKLKHLEATYPQFFSQALFSIHPPKEGEIALPEVPSNNKKTPTSPDALDITTVIRASQSISKEIILESLIKKIMEIVIENSGAERVVLALKAANQFVIDAEITSKLEMGPIAKHLPLSNIPNLIVNETITTKELVVLEDATKENVYSNDPYIRKTKPKSILSIPLLSQGVVIGFLYFEHYFTAGVFSSQRCALLSLLSSQIAIAIENARFYNVLEDKACTRTHELNQKNAQLAEALDKLHEKNAQICHTKNELQKYQKQLFASAKIMTLGQIIAGISHEVNAPLETIKINAESVNTVIKTVLNDLPVVFDLLDTPEKLAAFLSIIAAFTQQKTTKVPVDQNALFLSLEAEHVLHSKEIAKNLAVMELDQEAVSSVVALDKEAWRIIDYIKCLYTIASSNKNILNTVEYVSKIMPALKTYLYKEQANVMELSDIVSGIDTVLTLYQHKIADKIELIKNVKQIPKVLCRIYEINQVWTNIIHNSMEAMKDTGILEIDVSQEKGFVVVKIASSRPQIPENTLQQILGLRIAKKIVDEHQGSITMTSLPEKTTFTVSLPCSSE